MEKVIKEKEDNLKMDIAPLDAIPVSHLLSTGANTTTTSSTQTTSVEQVTHTL